MSRTHASSFRTFCVVSFNLVSLNYNSSVFSLPRRTIPCIHKGKISIASSKTRQWRLIIPEIDKENFSLIFWLCQLNMFHTWYPWIVTCIPVKPLQKWVVHLLFMCGPSASFFCLPYTFSIELINIRKSLTVILIWKIGKTLKIDHNASMLVTVDYIWIQVWT